MPGTTRDHQHICGRHHNEPCGAGPAHREAQSKTASEGFLSHVIVLEEEKRRPVGRSDLPRIAELSQGGAVGAGAGIPDHSFRFWSQGSYKMVS